MSADTTTPEGLRGLGIELKALADDRKYSDEYRRIALGGALAIETFLSNGLQDADKRSIETAFAQMRALDDQELARLRETDEAAAELDTALEQQDIEAWRTAMLRMVRAMSEAQCFDMMVAQMGGIPLEESAALALMECAGGVQ